MKHIVLVGNTSWSMYNFRSGLIKGLIDKNYKVTVISPKDNNNELMVMELGASFVDINISAKGTNPFIDVLLIFKIKSILDAIKPDFVFFYTIKPNIYGSFAAQMLKIPHIAVITGLGYTFIKENIVSKIARVLYKLAFTKANEVWFLNKDDLKVFNRYNLIYDKGFILKGEGINLSKFKPTLNQSNDISFLLIARMLWDKGIGEFVEASKILKTKYPLVKFNLLGFIGVDNPSAISKEQINEWQEDGLVNYLGSTSDVVPFIQDASCIVLPSYREGIPITLLEASSMTKPIVTTNSIGCKDTIDDGLTGFLCEPKNFQSLANAMEKIILLSPLERQKMGEAGRRKMENEFDEKLIVQHYLDTLKKYNL